MINNDWISQSKGIAIILVVLGHTILGFQSSYMFTDYNNIFDYINFTIYSFHMPLFFIISGYTYSKFEKVKNVNEYINLIKKKLLNLIIPYFIFSAIQITIKIALSGSTNMDLSLKDILLLPFIPQEQFWFLYTLFFIFCIIPFFNLKIKNKLLILLILFLLNMVEIHMSNLAFAITSFCAYSIYFYVGILISEEKTNKKINLINKYINLFSLLIYLVINIFIYNININLNIERFLGLILALLGSVLTIGITNTKTNSKIINFIGGYSYEIFLLHTIFGSGTRIILIKIFKIQSIGIHLALALILSIGAPIIIAKISKNIKILDFLFKPSRYIKLKKYKYTNQ